MIILDTDHVTLLQWGGESANKIERRMKVHGVGSSFPTAIVTYEEQMRGWMARISEAKSVLDEVRMYARLSAQLKFYSTMTIFEFTEKAATEFQRLRAQKIRIGTMDLKIAAIALANDATVFSRNIKDFSKVPGLRVEDASD